MKITCNVIKDLLPLYKEELLSDDSKILVEKHLETCNTCKEYLINLCEPEVVPVDSGRLIYMFKETIDKDKRKNILFFVSLISIFLIALFFNLTSPMYIPYHAGLVDIRRLDKGLVYIKINEDVSRHKLTETSNGEYVLETYTTTLDKFLNRLEKSEEIASNVNSLYYSNNDNTEAKLLYGIKSEEGVIFLPRLFLTYYFYFSIFCLIIFIIIFLKTKKDIFIYPSLIPLSFIISQLILKGFNFVTYNEMRDFSSIVLLAVPIYLFLFSIKKKINSA